MWRRTARSAVLFLLTEPEAHGQEQGPGRTAGGIGQGEEEPGKGEDVYESHEAASLHSLSPAKYPGENAYHDQQEGRAQKKRQLRDGQQMLEGGIEKTDDFKQRCTG